MFGQIGSKNLSKKADYIQLDCCGLTAKEVVEKYLSYKTQKPVMLHGDWEKKGCSANSLFSKERRKEYLNITSRLNKLTVILGFTIHPPTKSKASLKELIEIQRDLIHYSGVPFYMENRSQGRFKLSKLDEILEYIRSSMMTIDLPQLYISTYKEGIDFYEALRMLSLYSLNIRELHIGNVKRINGRHYVGRKIDDGLIDIKKSIKILGYKGPMTFEVLGGIKAFEEGIKILKEDDI